MMASGHLNEELLNFKYNATEYLRFGDRGQLDYPDPDRMYWTNTRKEDTLKMLRRWRWHYQMKITLEEKKQRALTKFGFTAKQLDGEIGRGHVTRTGRRQQVWRRMREQICTPNRSLFGAVT